MKYLIQGGESAERIGLLLQLTKLSSESQKQALVDHYVKGATEAEATTVREISQSNFNRANKRLNEVAGVVEQIKEIDWVKFKSVK